MARVAEKIFALSLLQHPPRRLLLGLDAVRLGREHAAELMDDVNRFERWSDDLRPDD